MCLYSQRTQIDLHHDSLIQCVSPKAVYDYGRKRYQPAAANFGSSQGDLFQLGVGMKTLFSSQKVMRRCWYYTDFTLLELQRAKFDPELIKYPPL